MPATTVFHSRWMASPAVSVARSSRARAPSAAASCTRMSAKLVRSRFQVRVIAAWYDQSFAVNPGALVPRSVNVPAIAGASASLCASASFSAARVLAEAAATAGRRDSPAANAASSGSGCRSSARGGALNTSGFTPLVDSSDRAARATCSSAAASCWNCCSTSATSRDAGLDFAGPRKRMTSL